MPYDSNDAATDSTARHAMIEELKRQGDKLFDRPALISYWEELRRNFYPERESFDGSETLGEDIAANLMTSYPLIVRRDLGNTFSAMLRNSAKPWFKNRTARPDRETTQDKQYLEWATEIQRNAMYDTSAGFVRACREADHDFVTFGQCAIQEEFYRPRNGAPGHLLFRNRHLRDVAWREGVTGQVDTIYRRDEPTALDLSRLFPGKLHPKTLEYLSRTNPNPYHECNIWHCVIPSDLYREMPGGKEIKQPWVSIYIDVDNQHEIECVGQWTRGYTIARWQTVSGSQYAHSAAMVAMLPDARLLQAVTLVLLESGEKAANPPTIAVQEAIRSDIALYAGGTTWVDRDYDERLGEALRPITQDKTGLQYALELVRDIRGGLRDAAFLSKLDMPPVGGPEMTAYEVGQRVQEYIRNALPLFEPVETEYNASICNDSFDLLWHNSPEMQMEMPKSLMGADRQFEFESPLRSAADKAKAGQFIEAGQIIAEAAKGDPSVVLLMDFQKAGRDVLGSIAPPAWLRTEDAVDALIQNQKAQQQQQQLLALMEQGSKVAQNTAAAAADVSTAMPNFQLA
jgi:hypothetical protein